MPRLTERLKAIYRAAAHDLTPDLARLHAEIDELRTALNRHDPHVAYLGNNEAVVTTTWGCRLIIRTDDYILSPELMSTGTFEPGLTALFPQLIRKGDTVVDVGANIGYYSLLAGLAVGPEGFVVAVEPHPRTAQLLAVNLVLNGMSATSSVAVLAAYSGVDELEFFIRKKFASNSSLGPVDQPLLDFLGDTQESIRVSAIDLDTHLDGLRHTGHVGLIKVDVEGAELAVFQGALRTMRESRPRVVFEWCPGQQIAAGAEPARFIEVLQDLDVDAALITGTDGHLERLSLDALAHVEYANVLLVPAGAPLTIG